MGINIGQILIKDIKLGTVQIKKVYLGQNQIIDFTTVS